MMNDAPSQTQDKFIVRLPDGMRDRIKAAADANNRSMNAEIVATLEDAYPLPDLSDALGTLADRLERLQSVMREIAKSAHTIETTLSDEERFDAGMRLAALETAERTLKNEMFAALQLALADKLPPPQI